MSDDDAKQDEYSNIQIINKENNTMIRRSKIDIDQTDNPWIKGCADWVWKQRLNGWGAYYLNIMFQPYPGKPQAGRDQMKRAICKGFYSRYCTEFAHHPTRPSQQNKLPILWLFPDRPIGNRKHKTSILELQFNDNGVHYNGPMMIPPVSRFKECPIQHIHGNQRKYAVHGIERIYVQKINWDSDRVLDYAGKTTKWDRELRDDIIILPDPGKRQRVPVMSVEERAMRDFQSRHNVSDEIAGQMLRVE
jgi:hypothetical protein